MKHETHLNPWLRLFGLSGFFSFDVYFWNTISTKKIGGVVIRDDSPSSSRTRTNDTFETFMKHLNSIQKYPPTCSSAKQHKSLIDTKQIREKLKNIFFFMLLQSSRVDFTDRLMLNEN